MAASDESIHCCATAKQMNGIAIQVTPIAAISGHSERGTGRRAAGMAASARAPKAMRPNATTVGAKCSQPDVDEEEGGAPRERDARRA